MINPTRVFALPLTTLPLITLTALSLTLLPSFSASAAVIEPVNNEKLAIVEVRHSNLAGYFMGQAPEILLSGDTGSTVLQPGQKYRFLPSPGRLIQLRQNASTPSYSLNASLPLIGGQLHLFDVPQLEFSWPDQAFNVEVGPIPRMEVRLAHHGFPFVKFPLDQQRLAGNKPYLALGVLPGSYEISYAIMKPFNTAATGTTQWGRSQSFSLLASDIPERSTMRFHTTDKKVYADAVVPHCQGSQVYVWSPQSGTAATDFKVVHNLPLANNELFHDVKYYAAPHGTPLPYFAQFGNIQLPLNVAAGKRGEIEVKRLDVNQVKVVREDQSEYLAPSKFRVQYKRADGMMADYELSYHGCPTKVGQFDAPAGLYLPPGDYKVILDYKTAEGQKVKVIDTTL